MQRLVKVDGKTRIDKCYPAGFMGACVPALVRGDRFPCSLRTSVPSPRDVRPWELVSASTAANQGCERQETTARVRACCGASHGSVASTLGSRLPERAVHRFWMPYKFAPTRTFPHIPKKTRPLQTDVVSIDKTDEHFRLIYDQKGRFVVHRITALEAQVRATSALGRRSETRTQVTGRGVMLFGSTIDERRRGETRIALCIDVRACNIRVAPWFASVKPYAQGFGA